MKGRINRRILKESSLELNEKASVDLDFVLLVISASAICALGFKMNNTSAIIGAMVISPLMFSILSASVSTFYFDVRSLKKALNTLVAGTVISLGTSILIGLSYATEIRSEISGRLFESSIDYFWVAIFCGLGGTYAFFSPRTHQAVGGMAISVALLPPIVISGIGLGIGLTEQDMGIVWLSSKIIVSNLIGIYLGSLLMMFFLDRMSKD